MSAPVTLIGFVVTLAACSAPASAASLTVKPAGHEGCDVFAGQRLVAPLRLSTNGAIVAGRVEASEKGVRLSQLHCQDPSAVVFGDGDFVSVTMSSDPRRPEPLVRFRLTIQRFDAKRWQALFPGKPAPFHFLTCALPTAQVWHQRGWLMATPNADPFPLLQDVHVGTPEIACKWNRHWSYLCPLGAHPIQLIGVWDPAAKLYVGYDFQEARATDQSERYVATAYCWQQGAAKSFIALAFPHGGLRYGELVYPKGGEVIESRFHLIVDTALPDTEDPNERFQARLFARYQEALPRVPARNDLSWIPGGMRLADFAGPIGLGLWGPGGEGTFYPNGTVLVHGWCGHREMPIDTAARRGDTAAIEAARQRIEVLLAKYAKRVTVAGEECLFWEKPLEGAWHDNWGGPPVTTLHNTDAWYPARVLVELYRYDRARGKPRPEYLRAIDGIFCWTKHFVWTRNEFADVPSSPFAIGGTLSAAFLLDYYFTFRDDPARCAQAELALRLAANVTWRYLPIWAMDSDRYDGALDGSFLIEPNSGRDWAGLACANEVHWNIDTLTQVYVHTGDPRMRYYLRGILQRWPQLYRNAYESSISDYGGEAMTEGLGFFDGSGPGRGGRYNYGVASQLPLNEPIGASKLRVVAGTRAAIAFCKDGTHSDVADYATDGRGACSFRVISALPGEFDVSLSYPYVDIARLPARIARDGRTRELTDGEVRRPEQSPSSLYLRKLRHGDVVRVGDLPTEARPLEIAALLTFDEAATPQPAAGFALLPIAGEQPLAQDWNDLDSFAGIDCGQRWAYGVPYHQGTRGTTRPAAVAAPKTTLVFVLYAPAAGVADGPTFELDDGTTRPLTGKPAPAWRGWPPIFRRVILIDYAAVPAGQTVRRIDPHGHLLVAVTATDRALPTLAATRQAMDAAAKAYAEERRAQEKLLTLRRRFEKMPAGKIAILPGAASGPAANFLGSTGLKAKCVTLSRPQLIDPAVFHASRFPLALYLDSENYVKTVRQEGDGQTAVMRYLASGGTLALLASGPYPMFYGDGPGGQHGPSDPLPPRFGLPLSIAFETPPAGVSLHCTANQEMLPSLPARFPFPEGDHRLRGVDRARLDTAHKYTPWIRVHSDRRPAVGDAACYVELGAGPGQGGRVLYIWSTLLAGPQGDAILADAIPWLLEKTLP